MPNKQKHIEKLQSLQQIYLEQKLYACQARAKILALIADNIGDDKSELIESEINNAIKRQDFILQYFNTQVLVIDVLEKYLSYNADSSE